MYKEIVDSFCRFLHALYPNLIIEYGLECDDVWKISIIGTELYDDGIYDLLESMEDRISAMFPNNILFTFQDIPNVRRDTKEIFAPDMRELADLIKIKVSRYAHQKDDLLTLIKSVSHYIPEWQSVDTLEDFMKLIK